MTPENIPDPDWGLLPRFPERFFGLEQVFDRRDLKRAYNRLLRRFKPEQYPEEFKQLRGAYEMLESRLQFSEGIGVTRTEPPEPRPASDQPVPARFDCVERMQQSSVEEVVAALTAFESKSSDNWCQLAILRDELERENPLAFYDVLIEGVRATNSAHSVSALLYEACQETLPEEARLPLLERMQELCTEGHGDLGVRPEGFFYLTERLWLDLASSMEFSEFEPLLREKRAAFGEPALEGYLGLLIRLVPRLGLRGDPAWVDEAMELIDEHYHSLPPNAQNAVVEFDWVDRYRASRHWLLNGNPLREQIDQTMVLLSAGDVQKGPAALKELLSDIREDPASLLEAFTPGQENEFEFFLDPLWWYAEENEAQLGGPMRRIEQGLVETRVVNFAQRLESRTDWSPLGMLWLACTFGTLAVMLALVVGLPCALVVQLTDGEPLWRFGGIVVWLVLVFQGRAFGFSLSWLLFMPSTKWSAYFSERIYRRSWRSMMMEFLEETGLARGPLLSALLAVDEPGISNCQFLAEHAAGDPAISLYSLALQFGEPDASRFPFR